jgi:hypothetical protein
MAGWVREDKKDKCVDNQIVDMVRYGAQLLVVDNVDGIWHIMA